MKLSLKGLATAAGLSWGGAMLVVGLANLTWTGYGQAFLELTASLYPGYEPGGGFGSVLVGTLYGLVDGAGAGLIFGLIYNFVATRDANS